MTAGIPIVPVCHSGLRVVDLPMPLSLPEAIEADEYQKTAAEGIRRAIRLLEAS